MDFFKPKQPLTNSSSPSQPPHLFLQQAFTSLQANVCNFLQNVIPKPPFPSSKSPPSARVSNFNSAASAPSASSGGGQPGQGNDVMSSAAIKERLAGVPVYALSNPGEEFVLVSPVNSETSLGLFCLSEADATALLNQMASIDPSMRNGGSRVVPVALNEVVQLKVDGVAFRLIPEASQVMNAIKERKRNGISDAETFRGVPVFQSKCLALRNDEKRYRPVFFRKEDLERSLSRASKEQNLLNPALKGGDIEVAVLEDIVEGMKDSSTSTWNDVVFIPPGFDVSTDPPRG